MSAPMPFLIDPPLHLDYLPGKSRLLVLAFTGVGDRKEAVPTPEAIRLTGWDGENHVLFIGDASRSWMNAPGLVEKLCAAFDALVERIQPSRIVAFGNSMGGSSALIFAGLRKLDAVLAIVPQYSVKRDLVPEEKRWMHFREHITEWIYPSVPPLTADRGEIMVLHGGEAREMIHARRFQCGPGVDHYVVPQYGHALALCLRNTRVLRPLMTHFLTGNMSEARKVLEGCGGLRFADYWQQQRQARRERRKNAAAV